MTKVELSEESLAALPRPRGDAKQDMAAVVGSRLSDSLPPELVAKLEAAGLTEEDRRAMAQAVLDAQNATQEGDPVGTVRRDETSGVVYVRVDRGGVHMWRVVDPANGEDNTFDTQTITHPVIAEPINQ